MTSEQLLARRALRLARDLIEIASQVMPSTFLATDSRVLHARETIERLGKRKRPVRAEPEEIPADGPRRWQVWCEGYAATGERAGARLIGAVEARTFEEACRKLLSKDQTYDPKCNTLWACNLFDNERDARRSFG